jgi:hypothetical protein
MLSYFARVASEAGAPVLGVLVMVGAPPAVRSRCGAFVEVNAGAGTGVISFAAVRGSVRGAAVGFAAGGACFCGAVVLVATCSDDVGAVVAVTA